MMERWSVDRKMRRNVKIADIDTWIKSCVVSSQNQGIEYNVIVIFVCLLYLVIIACRSLIRKRAQAWQEKYRSLLSDHLGKDHDSTVELYAVDCFVLQRG